MSSVNDILGNRLAGPASEQSAGQEMRRDKASSSEDSVEDGERSGSLREMVIKARRAMDLKGRVKDKLEEKVTAPAKIASGRAWQWSWFALIPSWGLSLIILDILWFGSLVTNLIAKPGEEWIPKKALAAGGDAGKLAGKAIGIVERMGLGLLNFIAFLIVMAVLAIIVWIADNTILVKVAETGVWVLEWVTK